MADDEPRRARRTFGPVVLLGLAGGTLAAVGGTKAWVTAEGAPGDVGALVGYSLLDSGEMPAATAVALVILSCWGVVLVTRGRVRRSVTVLGAVAAIGLAAAVCVGWSSTAGDLREAYAAAGVEARVTHTGWFWASATGAVVTLVAGVLAVRWVPQWPEMGNRYDAPSTPAAAVTAEGAGNLELWKAMDEGHDPTA